MNEFNDKKAWIEQQKLGAMATSVEELKNNSHRSSTTKVLPIQQIL